MLRTIALRRFSKDWRSIQSFSIEKFFSDGMRQEDLPLEKYLEKSAKLSLIDFKSEEEKR